MPTSYHETAKKKETMTPNGCGSATKNIKDGEGSIRSATILRSITSSSRTHLLGYNIFNLQLKIRLLQGKRSPLFLVMMLVTGTLDDEGLV